MDPAPDQILRDVQAKRGRGVARDHEAREKHDYDVGEQGEIEEAVYRVSGAGAGEHTPRGLAAGSRSRTAADEPAQHPRKRMRAIHGRRVRSGELRREHRLRPADWCPGSWRPYSRLLSSASAAQTLDARLDALVAPYREGDAPGMVAILIREGRVRWQAAFGLANLETHRPITLDTQFELASMTKQFTAMAIMILSEQGKLKFDDTLDKYCPEFPPYARTIHIRDLLHHVSGLPDYEELMVGKIGDNFFRSSKSPPAAHEFTSAEVLKTLSWQPKLKFVPGSGFEYSNSGYEVLGQIIERVSGKRYAEFLREQIFDPLGMHDTLVLDERRRSGPRLALAYQKAQRSVGGHHLLA